MERLSLSVSSAIKRIIIDAGHDVYHGRDVDCGRPLRAVVRFCRRDSLTPGVFVLKIHSLLLCAFCSEPKVCLLYFNV